LATATLTLSQHASFWIKRNDLLEQPGQIQLQDAGSAANVEKLTGAVK
jgi:hypothetical protein